MDNPDTYVSLGTRHGTKTNKQQQNKKQHTTKEAEKMGNTYHTYKPGRNHVLEKS